MLHQDSAPRIDVRVNQNRTSGNAVSILAYQSRAVIRPTKDALNRLLDVARKRNQCEGLTGLLVYNRGYFFQWLEGPSDALSRVWDSIQRDGRHCEIKVLREDVLVRRFFESWDMRLTRCKPGGVWQINAAVEEPHQLLAQLFGAPTLFADDTWDDLVAEVVVPHFRAALGTTGHVSPMPGFAVLQRPAATAAWHAPADAGLRLGHLLMSTPSAQITSHVESLRAAGAGLESLYGEVFEPAQRHLGDCWQDDICNDFELTLALAKLQMEARRVGSACESTSVSNPAAALATDVRSVLLSSQPGEPHCAGISMSTSLFCRGGWDVTCAFPNSNHGLCTLVSKRWFDVVELSLSGALRRDHRLDTMRDTVNAVHAASRNRAVIITVGGRTFLEQPHAYRAVSADACCKSALDGVGAAHRLVDAAARSRPH